MTVKRLTLLFAAVLMSAASAPGVACEPATADCAMGPQYDTAHVYVPVAEFDEFIRGFISTFGGKASGCGRTTLIVTDGAPPWPYSQELTGYGVAVLKGTLVRAQGAGVKLLVPTDTVGARSAAMVPFPGGYIAELHATTAR
ncbi:hypothetical protein [Sphingobium sp.]|uniref:hypothetical protein n=1 Tax=Sphingobium sp. TaxID=1912891 RepID=UPI0026377366|nr:hypothetical protein [Sphingobium sp.]